MSSPARSTVSAASAGAIDDFADSIDALYCKDEAMAELKSEVMEALHKEVRSLDDDSWMFAAPRSRINLVSWPANLVIPIACSFAIPAFPTNNARPNSRQWGYEETTEGLPGT